MINTLTNACTNLRLGRTSTHNNYRLALTLHVTQNFTDLKYRHSKLRFITAVLSTHRLTITLHEHQNGRRKINKRHLFSAQIRH